MITMNKRLFDFRAEMGKKMLFKLFIVNDAASMLLNNLLF